MRFEKTNDAVTNRRDSGVRRLVIWVSLALMLLVPVAAQARGAGELRGAVDPAVELFGGADFERLLQAGDDELSAALDVQYRLEHDVPIGGGRTLRVYEYFTLRNWLEHPRRGVLFLDGSAFNGLFTAIPHPGYDGTKMANERGFFAFSVDYLGVGESYRPADGRDADFAANVEAVERALRYLRFVRHIPKMDLVGAGLGGAIATQLGADRARVHRVVMYAALYKEISGGPLTFPPFIEALRNAPNGYFFLDGPTAATFAAEAPVPVQEYTRDTQAGSYPTPNFLSATELPFYDPSVARVPGLQIYGLGDFVAPLSDAIALTNDYGRDGAELVILPDSGHAARTEAPEDAAAFWDAVWSFIEPW